MSPLSRTMKYLKEQGYLVEKTEYWNGFARHRVDLFGFADAIAIRGNETLAVQTTSGSNVEGFPTRNGIIRKAYPGMLSAPPIVRPRPFEIVLKTPTAASNYLKEAALVRPCVPF